MRALSIFLIGVTSFFPTLVQPNGNTVIPSSPPVMSKDTAFSFYESFKKLTSAVTDISNRIEWESCVSLGQLKAPRPHKDTVFNLYVDKLAEDTIAANSATFSIGSTIKIENLESDIQLQYPLLWESEGLMIAGPYRPKIYGMTKRAPGFDPQNSNWEYFYDDGLVDFLGDSRFTRGRLVGYIVCHAKAKDTDYVFKVINIFGLEIFRSQNDSLINLFGGSAFKVIDPFEELHQEIFRFQIWDREKKWPSEISPRTK